MLELKNISFEIEDENDKKTREILQNVSLQVEDRSFVVITGPNGGGKSTLAKIIMGVENPTSGQIIYNGEDITNLDITERARRGIGFAFQQPVRFKGLFVKDLLQLAAGRKLSTDEACTYLSEVGLCAVDYIDRELNSSLSGGELKRIEIAMLMVRGVKISIFDEPEAGIDLWSFQNLIRVFEKLRDENQSSVIIISHQERILEIADKIVVIANGQVNGVGLKNEILPELLSNSSKFCRFYGREM
ncbi:ATP-binding cassette domain-containing protein [Selenomonadales bacterium OttesenSCG-928-I06]|nr:ATP-binding cassette domain-containing protein [Selenomonadales bacterium OttesenSCG-928-I06]